MSRANGEQQLTSGAGLLVLRPLGDTVSLIVVALAVVLLGVLVSDPLGWAPLSTRGGSLVLLAIVVAAVVGVGLLMRRELPLGDEAPGSRWGLRALVAGPALVLVTYAVAAFLLPTSVRVEWFLNGDHVRHLVLVADERARGSLSYESRIYPRGWHSSVALLWSISTGADGNRPDLERLVNVMATSAWLLSAALALATSTLAAAMARRVGLSMVPACITAALAGAVTLWPSFLGNYQALGLESSLVGALVLAVCMRELLERAGSLSAFLVCSSGLLLMGHTWQLLLPVSALAALASAWAYARRGGLGRHAMAVMILGVAALAIFPSFRAVATTVGVAHAAAADIVAPAPLITLALTVVSASYLAWRHREDRWALLVLTLFLLPAVTSVAIAIRVGVPVTSYYPAKLLWHSAALGLCAIAACAGLIWGHLGARPSPLSLFARSLLGAAGVICTLGAIWAPMPAYLGYWSTADGAKVLSLLKAEGAERATVVWSDGRLTTDAITRITLDGYKPEGSRTDTPQGRLTVPEECDLLNAATHPVILSNQPLEEVRARYACAPTAEVIEP